MAHIARTGLLRHTRSIFTPLASSSLRPLSQSPLRSAAIRDALRVPSRIAAFHATSRKSILTAEPQKISGTVNDPAPVPEPSPMDGSYHWTFERIMSAGLIPLTLAPFISGVYSPVTDAVFCAALLIHSHLGFDSVITDYIPNRRMPRIRNLFNWLLRLATVVVGIGLYQFETNDVGITEAVRRIWTA